jgi:CRP/FNR family transcriptional regulator, cyclic AMP receptor protein
MTPPPANGFLGALTAKQRLQLSMDSPQRGLARGAFLFMPGDECAGVYIVVAGRIKISRTQENGRELTLGMVEAGELFGLECLQGLAERETAAQAMEDCRIMLISEGRMQGLLREQPELSIVLIGLMGQKLRSSEQVIERLLLKDVKARLAALLLDLAARCGEPAERGILLAARITHQELANLIGSTRETTTATLNQFKRNRLIDMECRRITIAAPSGLERLAC